MESALLAPSILGHLAGPGAAVPVLPAEADALTAELERSLQLPRVDLPPATVEDGLITLAIHANSVLWDEEVPDDTKRRLVEVLVQVFLQEEALRTLDVYDLYWDTICRPSEPSAPANRTRDLLLGALKLVGAHEWATAAADMGLRRLHQSA